MIKEALLNYSFTAPKAVLIRHNENMTYEITDGQNRYLLRIHKPADGLDFSFQCGNIPKKIYIESEIELLLKLGANSDILLQRPVKNKHGLYITSLSSGEYATVLLWVEGEVMTNIGISNNVAYEIGKRIARLHNQLKELPHMNRYSYDETMISRVLNEITLAYNLRHLGEQHYQCISTYLLNLSGFLKEHKKDFILVHADVSKSNLLYYSNQIIPIDFSLSGYSLPEMDLADISCSLNDITLTPHIIKGYQSIGTYSPNESYVDLYSALSIILYIAYHHSQFHDDEKSQKSLDRWTQTIIKPALSILLNLMITY